MTTQATDILEQPTPYAISFYGALVTRCRHRAELKTQFAAYLANSHIAHHGTLESFGMVGEDKQLYVALTDSISIAYNNNLAKTRPLPYRDPDKILRAFCVELGLSFADMSFGWCTVLDWQLP